MNGYNFTDRVRKVLQMAREEAARLHHEYVGTEHILLGLIREGEGVAAAVLTNLNVDLEEIQQKIEETVKKGKAAAAAGPDLPYTSRAKKVLELAMSEARELNHSYVGTEHLLLGLLREEKGIAAAVLTNLDVDLETIQRKVEETVVRGKAAQAAGPDLPYTGRAKRVLELAMTEARELKSSYVGTEHLLLGLLAERTGIAAQVLNDGGVTLEQARVETLRLLGTEMPAGPPEQGRRGEVLARMRALVYELLATEAPDAGRLAVIATELGTLLDELAAMR